MTFAPSSVLHALSVVVRAFPCAPIVRASCMYASSFGASAVATKSYLPIVYHTSIFPPNLRRDRLHGLDALRRVLHVPDALLRPLTQDDVFRHATPPEGAGIPPKREK